MDPAGLDRALEELYAAKDRWAGVALTVVIGYLDRLRPRVAAAAPEWVAAAARAKGIRPGSPLEGEEWTSGPYAVLGWIAAATQTLRAKLYAER